MTFPEYRNKQHTWAIGNIPTPLEIAAGAYFLVQNGSENDLVFLPTDGEFCLPLSSFSYTIKPQSATRKHLFLYPRGDSEVWKKTKKLDNYQKWSELP